LIRQATFSNWLSARVQTFCAPAFFVWQFAGYPAATPQNLLRFSMDSPGASY
jgi:hypothetical protein